MDINFQLLKAKDITNAHKEIVANLLAQQGKVEPPFETKAERCEVICLAWHDGEPFAMGAIKKKTKRVFLSVRANQPDLVNRVDVELGYLYNSRKDIKGIGKELVARLLETHNSKCVMATTEIDANPQMVSILNFFGFHRIGSSWMGNLHTNRLGLFIREPQ